MGLMQASVVTLVGFEGFDWANPKQPKPKGKGFEWGKP